MSTGYQINEWMLNRFSFNARQHSRNKTYQVWTHENHAVHLYGSEFIREKIEYLHDNPVRAVLADKPGGLFVIGCQVLRWFELYFACIGYRFAMGNGVIGSRRLQCRSCEVKKTTPRNK